MRLPHALLGLALTLVGCQTPVPAPAEKQGTVSTKAARRPNGSTTPLAQQPPVSLPGAGSLKPVAPPAGGAPTPSAGSSPAIAPSPAATPAIAALVSLTGTVTAPAGVLSNNGGSLIANNGGGLLSDHAAGLIANNGGSYRTLAVTQGPLAGARVYVLDAQGRPIRGGNGAALFATTDAQGRYSFSGELPTHNFRLAVELDGDRGLWQAILPKEGASPRQADIDLISTLTTSYIVGQYVEGQTDPQATLDKLPAAVEAETRSKAGAAYDRAGGALPTRFDAEATLPVVTALRQQDSAFDGQMEAVKKLLIAAGQSDMGNGQAATKARFGRLRTVLPLPDGGFWLCSEDDGRVWQVDPDGTLRALAGTGVKGGEPQAGQLATAAAIGNPTAVARDATGRLLILQQGRLWRVDAAGRLEEAATGLSRAEYVFAAADGAYWVADFNGGVVKVTGGAPGATFSPNYALALPPGASAGRLQSAGLGPDGKVRVASGYDTGSIMDVRGVGCVLDAAGASAAPPAVPGLLLGVAQDGTWASLNTDGSLVFTPTTGAAVRFPASQVAKLPNFGPFAQLRANDVDANGFWNVNFAFGNGKGYVFSMYEVHELAPDGSVRHVAGLDPARVADGDAGGVSLDTPTGAAVAADGTLYLVDDALKQVLRRDATGKITRFSGVGGWEIARLSRPAPDKATLVYGSAPAIEFGATYQAPAAQARYSFPSLIRLDAAGQAMVLDMSTFLRRLEPNGDLRSLLDVGQGAAIADYLPQPDGTTLLAVADGAGGRVERLAADGRRTTVATVAGITYSYGGVPLNLATGKDGRIYVLANGKLAEIRDGAPQPLIEDPRLVAGTGSGMGSLARLAVDAQDRVYAAIGNLVLRWSPGATQLEVLAGAGGKLLNGSTADDSLQEVLSPAFGPGGELYLVDQGNKQVKRLEAGQL